MEIGVKRQGLEKRFYDLCQDFLPTLGLKLYDLDYRPQSGELKIFILREETGTAEIEDCIKVDHSFDQFIDEPWVPEKLTLEVSSPGIFRELREMWHFEKAVGHLAMIHLSAPMTVAQVVSSDEVPKGIRGNMKFIARVTSVDGQAVGLSYCDVKVKGQKGKEIALTVPLNMIKKINLESEEI